MRYRPLNIRHGNGAAVVVRARENLVHVGYNVICNGEGWQLTYLIQLMENVRDIMRHPKKVLNNLTKHSNQSDYKYERLYRILFNEEMFYVAYQKLSKKQGNSTKGSDGKNIDGTSLKRIERLIKELKDESYQPQPSRRTYIPKKNGKMRPLGIPAFRDKLVQEVMRMVLESLYEGQFSYQSHGFRPGKSCHTALIYLQNNFIGTKWFIEGDIKGFFDNINHDVLIKILQERIKDDRFIRLIRKFLNAGYLEDWILHRTYSGTVQGGIISPILANIYLDKLDKYMEEYIQNFDKGNRRLRNPEARVLEGRKMTVTKNLKKEKDETKRTALQKEIREIEKKRVLIPYGVEMDDTYKRLKYVRYADDFLIGVIGSKEDCKEIKENIKQFLAEKLKLELSDEKTLITHGTKPAKFLGFDVYVRDTNLPKRDKSGKLKRVFGKKVVLKVTTETMRKRLISYDALKIKTNIKGKEWWKGSPRGYLANNDDLEILDKFNSEIRGFYNYYSIANNSTVLNQFYRIMKESMLKTFGHKYRTTRKHLMKKYRVGKEFGVRFKDKYGKEKVRLFYHDGFKRKVEAKVACFDNIPRSKYNLARTSLIDRLKARKCEYCGATDNLEMHHVRKLKDLKGKATWEKHMIARQRKTIAVCFNCHRTMHNGKF